MLVTTTSHIEGKKILEYRGPCFGQATRATGNLSNLSSGWQAMSNVQANSKKVSMEEIRNVALNELIQNARALKANAIIDLKVEIDLKEINFEKTNYLYLCKMHGTAVNIEI